MKTFEYKMIERQKERKNSDINSMTTAIDGNRLKRDGFIAKVRGSVFARSIHKKRSKV